MTFCGYHPDMESGLKQFGDGLAVAVCARQERLGVLMTEVAVMEQEEMGALSAALEAIPGGHRKIALEALTNLIKVVFAAAGERDRLGECAFDEAIRSEMRAISELIAPLEAQSQKLSGPLKMKKLAQWISEQ